MARRFILQTEAKRDHYLLPEKCGVIEAVQYTSWSGDEAFLLFESPTTRSWIKVYALDGPPTCPEEVRGLLRRAYTRISYRPVWMRFKDVLFVYPAPVNDGDHLIVSFNEIEKSV